ncbi:hypothetical protein Tco_1234225 [Tanacetum coccineum]
MELIHIVQKGLNNLHGCKGITEWNEVAILTKHVYSHKDNCFPFKGGKPSKKSIEMSTIPTVEYGEATTTLDSLSPLQEVVRSCILSLVIVEKAICSN